MRTPVLPSLITTASILLIFVAVVLITTSILHPDFITSFNYSGSDNSSNAHSILNYQYFLPVVQLQSTASNFSQDNMTRNDVVSGNSTPVLSGHTPDNRTSITGKRGKTGRRRRVGGEIKMVEQGLARARAAIHKAVATSTMRGNESAAVTGDVEAIYRNPRAFHQSYVEMEKNFKVYVYEEGEPPIMHGGPCKDIYTIEGRFITEIEHEGGKFRTRNPGLAHVYFMPFSVTWMVKYLYKPLTYDTTPLKKFASDYVNVISIKHPFWNRSQGADHFMLSCHDWGPETSRGNAYLYNTSIRALCNANSSEGFRAHKDVSIPEIYLYDGNMSPKLMSPSPPSDQRSHLAFFAGGLHGPIRPILLQHWKGRETDVLVHEYLPKGADYYEMMKNSRFCLCPSGYEVASPRIVEAIYAECVPVILSKNYVLPFSDVLRWEAFSIQVDVEDIPRLKKILRAVSEEKYKTLIDGVRAVRQHFVLNSPAKRHLERIHKMKKHCWPYFDPEFNNLPERIFGPTCSACIDNESLEDCTVIKVDSVNRQDLLLQVVQVLTELNLIITKGYISSDAGWVMDVFHVKDEHGKKLVDQGIINRIQQAIGKTKYHSASTPQRTCSKQVLGSDSPLPEHTALEMTGTDRPGLFSEISAALDELHCNIKEAHAWSHNARLACVAYISEQSSDTPIDDPCRLFSIEEHLTTVLRGTTAPIDMKQKEVKTADVVGGEGMRTNVERRLHQLMLSVRDFDRPTCPSTSSSRLSMESQSDERRKPVVSIENWHEKGYSIVSVECRDRPRLLFDTVCTIIDMQYVICHASIDSHEGYAFQEYFIRHIDGRPLNTESEKDRVIKCLEAAIERRVCEGIKLELCTNHRVGLLSDITRVLRENGLAVVRADVATEGERAINAFYVRDVSGKNVDMDFLESVKKEMDNPIYLQVKNETVSTPSSPEGHGFSVKDMLKSHIGRFSNALLLQ